MDLYLAIGIYSLRHRHVAHSRKEAWHLTGEGSVRRHNSHGPLGRDSTLQKMPTVTHDASGPAKARKVSSSNPHISRPKCLPPKLTTKASPRQLRARQLWLHRLMGPRTMNCHGTSTIRHANVLQTPQTNRYFRVEKYRPIFLDDVVGNTETIERLKIIAREGNMPHVIISGMPGIGKTTSVLCLARQMLGDSYKEAVLELNASDERGIDVVRNRIKGFAQKKVTLPAGRHKLVILDEADSMTSGAQQALRRTMEIYSNTTRFAFACNQSNKIIEPLQSRCAILRYAKLTDAQVVKRLMQIIEAEKVEYSDDGLAALVFSAEGDMRQAINNLQSTYAGFGFVSGDNVFKVVDSPHPIKVQAMLKACYEGNVDSALDTLRELWHLGYSSHDIISTMFKVTKTIPTLSEHSKLEFIKEIGFTHMKVLEGVQTLLQLSGCVVRLCKINMDPKRFKTPA